MLRQNLKSTLTPRPYLLVLVLWVVASLPAEAQLLRGRIVDEQSQEPLANATIQVEGTYRATIANAAGNFELELDAVPAALLIRHIGYATRRLEITAATASDLEVELTPVAFVMQEIVVTGEDPAIAIMRRVIKRKKVWRAALESFEAVAYSRYTVSNDTGIVFILESVSDAYWDRERGMREEIIGTRKTAGADMGGDLIPAAGTVANLYDDDISVAGHRLIGVTHPDALSHYRFSLEGTRRIDDTEVYDIAVEPRTRLTSGFRGRVSVHGDEYALLEAELQPGDAFLFPYPIRSLAVTYRQQFSSFGGQYWLPVDFRFEGSLQVSVSRLLRFPAMILAQVSRFTDYQINAELPEDLFEEVEYMRVDSAAVAADSVLHQEGLAVPLLPAEQLAYARTDTTVSILEAFEPRGAAARMARIGSSEAEVGAGGGNLLPEWLGLGPEIWYNRVDALHAGAVATVDAGEHLRLVGSGGWSHGLSGSERWSYETRARLSFSKPLRLRLTGSYRAGTAVRQRPSRVPRALSGIEMLLGGEDYFDYYRSEGYRIGSEIRVRSGRVRFSASLRNEDHSPLRRSTSYDLLGRARIQRPNPAIGPARFRAVGLGAALHSGPEFTLGLTGRKFLQITAERSVRGSDYDYARYELTAEWALRTHGRRRLLPAMAHVRLLAGTSSGMLPLQRSFLVEGGAADLRPFGTLRALRGQPYEGQHAVAFFWEHNFRTMPFEIIGLRPLVERGYSILVFGGHARTWPLADLKAASSGHHEVGVSLSGILGFVRLDLAWHPGQNAFALGYGMARIF